MTELNELFTNVCHAAVPKTWCYTVPEETSQCRKIQVTRAAPRRGHRLTCLHPAKQLQHSTIGVLEADDTNLSASRACNLFQRCDKHDPLGLQVFVGAINI